MRPLTPEDLLSIRLVGHPLFSPDENEILITEAYIDPEANQNCTRILRSLRKNGTYLAPEPLTQGPSDQKPKYAPDGQRIAFLSKRSGKSQIWMISARGGEPRRLTHIDADISEVVWSLDGTLLYGVARLEPEGIVADEKPNPSLYEKYTQDVKIITRQYYKLDGFGFFGNRRYQLIKVDAENGQVEALTSAPADHTAILPSTDGNLLYFLANRDLDSDAQPAVKYLYSLDLESKEIRQLTTAKLGLSNPSFLNDGIIGFTATDPEHMGYGNETLYRYNLESQELQAICPDVDLPFGDHSSSDMPAPGQHGFGTLQAGDSIYALLSNRGRVELVSVDSVTGKLQTVLSGERVLYSLHVGKEQIVFAYADHRSPAHIAVYDPKTQEEQLIAQASLPFSQEVLLSVPQRFSYHSVDHVLVDGWLLLPPEPKEKMPAILQIHGGPMAMYADRFFFEFQYLAQQGYAVIYTNPRGSLGYGHDFCKEIIAKWGDKDYQDCLQGLDEALRIEPRLDPAQLGVAGGSYGGFMVNWIVSHSDRFAAAVTMRSVVNRMSAMGTSDMGYLRVKQYGPNWWEDPTPYLQQSPLMYAQNIRTPLLIEHEENDQRCPIDQAEQLYAALKLLGVETRFVRYPNESHGMSRTGKPWHRVHRLQEIAAWFARFLNQ